MNFNSGLVNDGYLRKTLAAAGHLLVPAPMHKKGWSFLAIPFVGQLESLRVPRKDPFIARGTGSSNPSFAFDRFARKRARPSIVA
jgi:hypothetical protein